jgi:hypothetical protein
MPTSLPSEELHAAQRLGEEELRAAIEANKHIYDSHFSLDYLRNLNEEIISLLKVYFRPRYIGFDEMPERRSPDLPLIYACNHSGMAFPWDAIIFGAGLMHQHDYDLRKLFRPLAAPALSASSLMNPFLLQDLWKRVGAVDATGLNFETMMHYPDSNVLIYPEGIPGIGKGFDKRYQLQTFSTSMIRMAIKYRTDIIGVSCVNGEYINPWSYSFEPLNKLVKALGIPYLPVALQTPLLLIQPWFFYYAFPAKLTYVRGKRYQPWEMAGGKPWEEVSLDDIRRIRDEIQADMQAELSRNVELYGQKPFDWGEFWRYFLRNWRSLPYWTPIGWPLLFSEYDRRYRREATPPRNVVKGWFKFWRIVLAHPFALSYYLPLIGWGPILWRGLRDRRRVREWKGAGKAE